MTHTEDPAQSVPSTERPVGDLVRQLAEQVSVLGRSPRSAWCWPCGRAALIVGGMLLIVTGVLALAGRSSLRKATPPMPEEAAESIKAGVQVIKERAAR